MEYDVFISYSRKDSELVDRICLAFDKVSIKYFIDRQEISGGFEFPAIIADAILNSKVVLFIASENSYKSKYTNAELTFAFNEKPSNSILPYIIDRSYLPTSLRFVFSNVNWRTIETHPIDTVLIDDVLNLLGRNRYSNLDLRFYGPQELLTENRWKVGDYYNADGKEGVVFWVDESGKHGKIVSLHGTLVQWSDRTDECLNCDSEDDGMHNTIIMRRIHDSCGRLPILLWCNGLGEEWYIPSLKELGQLFKREEVYYAVDQTLRERNADPLQPRGSSAFYWSSTESDAATAFGFVMKFGISMNINKANVKHVRAISRF